jgi:hypothetical protein
MVLHYDGSSALRFLVKTFFNFGASFLAALSFSLGLDASAQSLAGFEEYWQSYPGDNVIMFKDGIYLYPCMGRQCESLPHQWIYGGKALRIGPSIIQTDDGNYYCRLNILKSKKGYSKCTRQGFKQR